MLTNIFLTLAYIKQLNVSSRVFDLRAQLISNLIPPGFMSALCLYMHVYDLDIVLFNITPKQNFQPQSFSFLYYCHYIHTIVCLCMFSGFIFNCRTFIKYDNPRLTAADLWLTSSPKLSRSDYLAKV